MTMQERMEAGLPYRDDGEGLPQARRACREKVYAFNNLGPVDDETRLPYLKELLGKTGDDNIRIEPPFHCDYGTNIEVGEMFYANYNLTILDVAKVTIGDRVMLGPNVSIYTAGHPVHPEARNSGYEYGIPITIGDNVWIGGNVVILPGVTIGDNVVVGAGSVVTKDIPENTIAAGNPCRIIREITEEDRNYYYKDREFDIDFHSDIIF